MIDKLLLRFCKVLGSDLGKLPAIFTDGFVVYFSAIWRDKASLSAINVLPTIYSKRKCNVVPAHAMKAYRESRGTDPFILHLGTLYR
jgi:hypothetical protein